jgi:hypothetical protein
MSLSQFLTSQQPLTYTVIFWAQRAQHLWSILHSELIPYINNKVTDHALQDLPEHGVSTVFVNLGNTKLELLGQLG